MDDASESKLKCPSCGSENMTVVIDSISVILVMCCDCSHMESIDKFSRIKE